MFRFLMTQAAKARRDAENWLEVADKVFHYRRDELKEAELAELNLRRDDLRRRVKQRADAGQVKLGIEALETVLHKVGGNVYPKTSLADNVEFFLAAAIVILGIRAFFVQPFKIPTNSMWPSYFGMKPAVYADPGTAPGPGWRVFGFLTLGATRQTAVAPSGGELEIPFVATPEGVVTVDYQKVNGRKWLVVPTELREYTFFVNGDPVRFRVPLDFSEVDAMVMEVFFKGGINLRLHRDELRATGRAKVRTGRRFAKGDTVFCFDVNTGDQLFVDRFSYHFFDPKVGEGFVFRTGRIERLGQDQYYIKRLVGLPGDVLEIRDPVLLRNGGPITGADAFDLNAGRTGLFRGYCNGIKPAAGSRWLGLLAAEETYKVPDEHFFALGDNSHNSLDGRFWGPVPAKDAVGRPLFIYYPFTKRWGPAR